MTQIYYTLDGNSENGNAESNIAEGNDDNTGESNTGTGSNGNSGAGLSPNINDLLGGNNLGSLLGDIGIMGSPNPGSMPTNRLTSSCLKTTVSA